MKRRAFVLGSNGPEQLGRLQRLTFAKSDAERMAVTLRSPQAGFDEIITPASNASKTELQTQLYNLASQAGYQDDLLFYFAGHGLIQKKKFYLALDDSSWDSLFLSSLPYGDVRDIVAGSNAARKVIILDCCHAGAAVDNILRVATRGSDDFKVVEQEADGTNASVLVACGPDGAAREAPRLGGGIMTALIIEAISNPLGKALESDGRVSMESLREWLMERTLQLRQTGYGDLETPLLHSAGQAKAYLTVAIRMAADDLAVARIRAGVAQIATRFEQPRLDYNTLKRVAAPLAKEGRRLTSTAIVAELLRVSQPAIDRDASVFAAAVMIHARGETSFLDDLIDIAGHDGRTLRGAAMWRVLRAIHKVAGDTPLSDLQRSRLNTALATCARNYDSRPGERFKTWDIVRMIYDIAKTKKYRLASVDEIFSPSQTRELVDWLESRKTRAVRPVPLAEPAAPENAAAAAPTESILDSLLRATADIQDHLSPASTDLSYASSTTGWPSKFSRPPPGKR